MAASGFTPISLYYSTTASAVPTSGNLANGELGLNIADMKLYAKNSAGTVTLLASNAGASGSVTSVSGTGTVNGLTLTGTVTTSGSLTLGGTLSGTASININGTVGATTPTTGAFTTITASTSSSVGTTIGEARIDIGKSGSSYAELQASNFGINYNMPIVLQRQGGNVGIGVTPSAWATLKAMQFAGGASLAGYSNTAYLNANCYFDGSWRYIASTNAGRYETAANHKWFTSTSGTAGNVISETQTMTLDSSGNLLVGTTTSLSAQAGRIDLSVNGSSTAIVSLGVAGSRQGYFYTPGTGIIIASENGALALTTTSGQAINFNTNNTKRFEFGTAGQFGIGATPSYGTAGQVLTSGGSGSAPTWTTAASGAQAFVAFGSTGGY